MINDCFNNQIDPSGINVKSAVLVVPKCNAYDELEDVELGERPKLKALALALDINYFTVEFLTNEIIL